MYCKCWGKVSRHSTDFQNAKRKSQSSNLLSSDLYAVLCALTNTYENRLNIKALLNNFNIKKMFTTEKVDIHILF